MVLVFSRVLISPDLASAHFLVCLWWYTSNSCPLVDLYDHSDHCWFPKGSLLLYQTLLSYMCLPLPKLLSFPGSCLALDFLTKVLPGGHCFHTQISDGSQFLEGKYSFPWCEPLNCVCLISTAAAVQTNLLHISMVTESVLACLISTAAAEVHPLTIMTLG